MQSLRNAEVHNISLKHCSWGCFPEDWKDAFEFQPPAHGIYSQHLIKKKAATPKLNPAAVPHFSWLQSLANKVPLGAVRIGMSRNLCFALGFLQSTGWKTLSAVANPQGNCSSPPKEQWLYPGLSAYILQVWVYSGWRSGPPANKGAPPLKQPQQLSVLHLWLRGSFVIQGLAQC